MEVTYAVHPFTKQGSALSEEAPSSQGQSIVQMPLSAAALSMTACRLCGTVPAELMLLEVAVMGSLTLWTPRPLGASSLRTLLPNLSPA